MFDPMDVLARRRRNLLLAVVQDFIATAEPVGSLHLASKYSLGVRAASVRSMMAELEMEGYLHQPHTSAGRIPTDKAFRFYVDSIIPNQRHIGFRDRTQIEFHYSQRTMDLAEVMRDTSRLLALMTGQAAVVVAPRLESVLLERVNFVRVRSRQVLAIFVAQAGSIQSRLIETEQDYGQDELDRMANYLNQCINGQTLEGARRRIEQALSEERARYDHMARAALTLGDAVISRPAPTEVYVEGNAQALEQPEFSDVNKLKELLRALEDKSALLNLLERSLNGPGLMVSIGSENVDARLNDLSVVAAAYASGSAALGSVAVVGPVRMDYDRVIPLVDYTAKALSRVLEP